MHDLGLRSLGRNISGTFLRHALGLVLGLLFSVIVARTLGAQGQGQYAVAILFPTMALLAMGLGIPAANAYYVGKGEVTPREALRASVGLSVILSLVGLGLCALVVIYLAGAWFPDVPVELLWVSALAFPVMFLQQNLISILQGVQDFRRYNTAVLAVTVLLLLFGVAALFIFDAGVLGVVVAFVAAYAVSALIALALMRHHTRDAPARPAAAGYWRRMLAYGWKAHIANSLAFINYRADIFLINLFMYPGAAGVYYIAVGIAEKVWVLSQSVSAVMLPRLSELHDDERKRSALTPFISKIVLVVTLIVTAGLFVAAGWLVLTMFGEEYSGAVMALRWLLPGIVTSTVARNISVDLAARGKVELNLYVALVVVTLNLVANVVLIPRLGIVGAAMATSLAYTVNMMIKFVIYRRITGNRWTRFVWFSAEECRFIERRWRALRGSG